MRLLRLAAFVFPATLTISLVTVSAAPDEVPAAPVRRVLLQKVLPVPPQPTDPNAKSPDQAELDKKALDAAGLKADDVPGLIAYLKKRTLNDADASKIAALIKKLGDEAFEERVKAEADLEKIGLPAIAPLKLAATNDASGAEVIYRAKSCLKRIEKVPQAEVAGAVVRALAKVKSPEVVPALLAYLPLADTVSVTDEIQTAITANAIRDGKPDQILIDALADVNAVRRTIAVVALLEGSPAGKRPTDIYPKLLTTAKEEKDKDAKFTMARSLLLTARETAAVPLLMDVIPDLNRGQIWQMEDMLAQLAGTDAPKARFKKSRESLVLAQTAWREWWTKAGGKIDLEKLDIKARLHGRFVVISHDYRFGQQGVITEYGANEKEVWKITGMMYPTDIIFTPNNRIWVADQNAGQVTERDMTGKVLTTRKFEVDNGGFKGPAQPTGIQLLTNGNLLITARNGVGEFDKDGKEVMKFTRTQQVPGWGNQDIVAARRLQNGQTAVAVMNNGPNGQNPQVLFLDEAGKPVKTKVDNKDVDKVMKTGFVSNNGNNLLEVAKDRLLITENNQIAEYDITTGKTVWTKAINNARCVQRLPNGNTLYIDGNVYPNRAVEITPEGEEVWSYQMKDAQVNLYRVMIR